MNTNSRVSLIGLSVAASLLHCIRFSIPGSMFSGFRSVHRAAASAYLNKRSSFSVLTDLSTISC